LLVNGIDKFVGRKNKRKQILRNVSCEIKGNEFVAIIGGSGAGKTTLMNAISGFEPDFIGNVYCNGIDIVSQFQSLKNIIGFVPQQDIIYENLTLWRMLYYTAKLKMSEDTEQQEIHNRIKEVLKMVELQDHQNTYIRKLSGGQKKRASIAVELLADPKLFFLDEPTSGLDPGTEKNLMITLNSLAKNQNKTVVMVTHTTENLHLCDKIIFMGPGGRLCFCGNVEEAKAFYETDSMVNVFNIIAENPVECERRFATWQRSLDKDAHYHRYRSHQGEEISKKKNVSGLRQFNILSLRYAELLFNDKARLGVLLLQPLLIAILLYMVADEHVFTILESTRAMLFAVSCSGIWIGLFNSIQEICKERVIIKREYMANLKLPVYISSKFLLQSLLGLIQSFILAMVFLGLVSVNREGVFFDNFSGEIFITMWLTILASIAMGFVISALVTTGDKAMAVAPFVLIIQLLFSGILFALEGAGEILSYVTVSRWSVSALGRTANLNELELRMQEEFPMIEHEIEPIFEATATGLMQTWLVLALMVLLFMVASTISLRRIAKDRR
jgi:ABC-type multidrug transport system ATPase subunit